MNFYEINYRMPGEAYAEIPHWLSFYAESKPEAIVAFHARMGVHGAEGYWITGCCETPAIMIRPNHEDHAEILRRLSREDWQDFTRDREARQAKTPLTQMEVV